jgi:SAM-dependent methyltransferase
MMDATPQQNAAQAKLWNGAAGEAWVDMQASLDRMFRPFEDVLLEAVPAGAGGHVLDVGCGTGATTLAIARALGGGGRCIGVDVSAPMIAAARARAARSDVPAHFIDADAASHAFEPGQFDRVVSRFGVMFFDDPVRAFANLRRATNAAGGLRFIAWRSPAENAFMTTAERAAASLLPGLPEREPGAPGQFAFADGERVRALLSQSGWRDVDIRPVDVECRLPEAELIPCFTRIGPVGQHLQQADACLRARVIDTVRAAFDPHVFGVEVRFVAACWVVDARPG